MWSCWNYTIVVLWLEHRLFLPKQWRCDIQLIWLFLFCFSMCAYPLNTHSLWLTDEWGRNERRDYGCSIFPFPTMTSFQYKWFTNPRKDSPRGKKGYNKVSWSFMFLKRPLLPFCVGSKFLVQMGSMTSLGCQCPAYSTVDTTCVPVLKPSFAKFPSITNQLGSMFIFQHKYYMRLG